MKVDLDAIGERSGAPAVTWARADRVELRVVDRGPGIPEADRDRAFLPFQRLGDTGTTAGVGLGLAVARGLTEAMGAHWNRMRPLAAG